MKTPRGLGTTSLARNQNVLTTFFNVTSSQWCWKLKKKSVVLETEEKWGKIIEGERDTRAPHPLLPSISADEDARSRGRASMRVLRKANQQCASDHDLGSHFGNQVNLSSQ
jgi:hypothetical protein